MYTSITLLSHLDDSLETPDRAGVIGVYIEVTKKPIVMKQQLDEKIYELSCECKEAYYANANLREFVRQMVDKLDALAREAAISHRIAMQESSVG